MDPIDQQVIEDLAKLRTPARAAKAQRDNPNPAEPTEIKVKPVEKKPLTGEQRSVINKRNAKHARAAILGKRDSDPSKPLSKVRYEKFARLVAIHRETQSEAYRNAISKGCTVGRASTGGSILAGKPHVAARIRFLLDEEDRLKTQSMPSRTVNFTDVVPLETQDILNTLQAIISSPDSTGAEKISAVKEYSERTGKGKMDKVEAYMPPDQLAEYESSRDAAIRAELGHAGQWGRAMIWTRDGRHEVTGATAADLVAQIAAMWDLAPPEKTESAQAVENVEHTSANTAHEKMPENHII